MLKLPRDRDLFNATWASKGYYQIFKRSPSPNCLKFKIMLSQYGNRTLIRTTVCLPRTVSYWGKGVALPSPKDLMLLRNRIYPSDYFTAFVLPLQLSQQRPNERWKHIFIVVLSTTNCFGCDDDKKNYAFERTKFRPGWELETPIDFFQLADLCFVKTSKISSQNYLY